MTKLIQTYEIGSLAKLDARVKAIAGNPNNPLSEKDVQEFLRFAAIAGADVSGAKELLESLLTEGRPLTSHEKLMLRDANALINLRLQEWAGLDIVYDGEARRTEMYKNVADQVMGFLRIPEPIRSSGRDSWEASVCVAEPRLKVSLDELSILREFGFVRQHATHGIKVPLDDPFMIANMTDNRFYMETLATKYGDDPRRLRYEAKRALTLALAEYVIRPQVEAVVKSGAKWIQLDIPSATIDIEHIPIMVEGINAVVKGIEGVKFSLHICYPRRAPLTTKSGYELLFPHILRLNPNVNHISLELANGNQYERDLAPFAKYQGQRKFEIGAGVIDITPENQLRGITENPEIVRGRITRAVNVLGDPSLVYAAPDCGLRRVGLDRALILYDSLVKGAELARRG